VETLNVVEFGPELVGMKAWRSLGLTEKLLKWGMNRRAAALAQVMVINRLVEPLSEWALIDWVGRTALPECLNVRISKSAKDRLYKTSDELMSRRRKVEEHLRETEGTLFGLNRSIVLYDVTNTHFTGLCQSNPKAARGKNKQSRNDCLQVAVGMAFDEYGFSLAHEVFEGNMADSKTLGCMLDRLSAFADRRHKSVAILDAGIATADNLQMLRDRGYAYLVNITRGSRARYADYFNEPGFDALPGRDEEEQVELKSIQIS
jgi:transposase